MSSRRKSFILLFFLLLAAPVMAQAKKPLDSGTVREVQRPDLIVLDSGRNYRLAGIRVPADHAAEALETLKLQLLNKQVRLYAAGEDTADRYGAVPAYVLWNDDTWMQAELVSRGLAWYSAAGSGGEMHGVLMAAEQKARAGGKGFWADPAYAVKTPATVSDSLHSFQLVEGKILEVAVKKDYAYLNFGDDWKTDFTISLPRRAWRRFGKDVDFTAWRGRMVRIRGWVESRNGPLIELTNPEQIEFVKP